MPPPPADQLATRIFLGPALRTQPDRRLIKLVREGYEAAFEEIVRRYRKPLDRFAAGFVGGRSEDVTQDAFSKALLALRGSEAEIELRPWLYRIVRNTALNDLRDGPPLTEELGETLAGGQSAAVEAERREEMTELMVRLRALPEPQRAAIVMRELEGLSHEEIAAALGVSGGAARQAIHRARTTLRDGFGMLVPLPLLRALFDHGAEAAGVGAGGVAAAGAAASVSGGAGAAVGGFGAAGALKVGLATALLAGSVGAGVAMQHDRGRERGPERAAASTAPPQSGEATRGRGSTSHGALVRSGQSPLVGSGNGRGHGGPDSGNGDKGDEVSESHPGRGSGVVDDDFGGDSQGGSGSSGSSGHRGSGHSGPGNGSDDDSSGEGASGESHSGRHGSGGESGGSSGSGSRGGGSGSDGSGRSGSGSGGPSTEDSGGSGSSHGGSGDTGSGSGGSGGGDSGSSGGPAPSPTAPTAPEPPPGELSGGSGGSGSGSGNSGSGDGGSDGGEDDS